MSVNIKNILLLLNEKYGHLQQTEPNQEENNMAENVSDILEGYSLNRVDIVESLEYDDCMWLFLFLSAVNNYDF